MAVKLVSVVIAMVALLALAAACSDDDEDADQGTKSGTEAPATRAASVVGVGSSGGPSSPSAAERKAPALSAGGQPVYVGAAQAVSAGGQAGIWVSGEGSITLKPDLVLLSIGVEATAPTVAEARRQAAEAMDAVVKSVKAHGLQDRDIQTRSFNISPQYEFQEIVQKSGTRTGKQVLVGYRVSNTASIKIRDLDAVGTIIDDVAAAGGDATRINGVSFTVEDPNPFMVSLREAAVADALAKARQFAGLTQVTLGRLVYIAEGGGAGPIVQDFGQEAFAGRAMLAAPSTSISGGELEIRLSVQAVFDIQ